MDNTFKQCYIQINVLNNDLLYLTAKSLIYFITAQER